MKELNDILAQIKSLANPANVEGMKRFGVKVGECYGVSMPQLRAMAKPYKNSTPLAKALWKKGWHETKILATLVANHKDFDEAAMNEWTQEFDSWDICDQACFNLFRYLPFALRKIGEYAADEREFVRRTAFSLIAGLAIGNKTLDDKTFLPHLKLVEKHAADERNFVRKAVNWALRQIGKRNMALREKALALSEKLAASDDKTARWIGKDALRELQSEKIAARIKMLS